MRKLFLLIGLFLTLSLSGQQIPLGTISSQGVVASAPTEMISNGGLDDATDWTLSTGWTIGGGVATYDDATNNSMLAQTAADMIIAVEANTAYTIEFDLTIGAGESALFFLSATDLSGYTDMLTYEGSSHITLNFTTPADISVGGIAIRAMTFTTQSFTVDNISLRLQ